MKWWRNSNSFYGGQRRVGNADDSINRIHVIVIQDQMVKWISDVSSIYIPQETMLDQFHLFQHLLSLMVLYSYLFTFSISFLNLFSSQVNLKRYGAIHNSLVMVNAASVVLILGKCPNQEVQEAMISGLRRVFVIITKREIDKSFFT